jgi:hypothetical protein
MNSVKQRTLRRSRRDGRPYNNAVPLITRLTRRFERRPLAKPNAAYFLWRFGANGVRTLRALAAPIVFHDTRAIARELAERGIVVGPSETFLSQQGRSALEVAAARIIKATRSQRVQEIIAGVAAVRGRKIFRIDLVKDGIPADGDLLKIALDVKLLEIVASYLGMWPSLHSIGAWFNYPTNEPATSSQLWHHDPEDLKIVKAFIYLDDVFEDNGPFTYIPGTHPFGVNVAVARKHKKKERLADEQINDVFPPSMWQICTGPAGTMILADTIGYHRGGKPTVGGRLLVTFTYTSGTPLVQHSIWLKGRQDWISSAIQRFAVRELGTAPPVKTAKKKSKY